MKTNGWENIAYLKTGTEKQRHIFEIINKNNIIDLLRPYTPVIVSSICIDIDIPESDIDIICHHANYEKFIEAIKSKISNFPKFKLQDGNNEAAVFSFILDGYEIEIYSSHIPVKQQEAYRHLSVMARLLNIGGNILRESVRSLKNDGYKSEAAFAKIIGLEGNPYHELLKLEKYDDFQLENILLSSTEVILKRTTISELRTIADAEKDNSVSPYICQYQYKQHCKVINENSSLYLTICRGNKACGHIILNTKDARDSIEFRRIVVYHKNEGIGFKAIKELENFCLMNYDVKRIWLDLFSNNARARYVYEKSGYIFYKSENFGGKPHSMIKCNH